MRYPSPSADLAVTPDGSHLDNSPVTSETANRPRLPINICPPVLISVDFGSSPCLLYTEPALQKIHAASKAATPSGFNFAPLPEISAGPTRMKMPASPTNNPRMACQFGFTPPGRMASATTRNIGMEPMTSAATPDGMVCSAHATNPLPPSRSRLPMMNSEIHCLRVGMDCPAPRCQMNRITPEIKKRIPAERNGGMLSTAKRIARYVEPQTMYSASKAIQILVFIFILWYTDYAD